MRYVQLLKAIDATSQQLLGRAAAAVNQSLVIRNWLVGGYIIEFEQRGEDRAKYGARLLHRLASDLKKRGVKGSSPDMLERMRVFVLCYPQLGERISASVMRKLGVPLVLNTAGKSEGDVDWPIPSPVVTESTASILPQISASVMRKSSRHEITPLSVEAVLHFSWTHLIELIRLDDPLKRAFGEAGLTDDGQ